MRWQKRKKRERSREKRKKERREEGRRKSGSSRATSMQWEEETGDGCSRDRRCREHSLNVYHLWVPHHCLTGWASSPPFYCEGSRVFRASTDLVEAGGGCGPQHLESSLTPDTQSLLGTGRAGSWGPLMPQRCSLSEHSSGLKKAICWYAQVFLTLPLSIPEQSSLKTETLHVN